MSSSKISRRQFIVGAGLGGATLLSGTVPFMNSAFASSGMAATSSMRGGSNNYSPNAPLVDNLGKGFIVHGTVLLAGSGVPLAGQRIQIWAATTRGGEREPSNHGSVMTATDGSFELEMSQIVPNFGQPHAHLAYDDEEFKTVFLRPVMPSKNDTRVAAHFVLEKA